MSSLLFALRGCSAVRNAARSSHVQVRFYCKPLFDKILIANRGEIACRVIRTAKRMGIKTVAIYSEADAAALHAKLADEAYCVGPAPSAQSYLNMPTILDVIKRSGAQAVHPGYGFLSENFKFMQLLKENGVTFIGPDHHAIHAMGDKIESKRLAKDAKVNVIPGFLGEVNSEEHVLQIANEIGYPVMIKASAGGGGKGMRVAWNDAEALEGFRMSKEEAMSSFGDDRMLIEKFIHKPRHIEIQIIADSQGNTLYLNERECSIQRRNQKVIEEAPSPFIDPATRRKMGEQAVALAKAVQYKSAGTVEMLVDHEKNFYFLEMNTRLQVEHPVTEYITGLDLVELMIRVAAGQELPLTQEDVQIKGWAFESRVYAEDPLKKFLPAVGRLVRYQEPTFEVISGMGDGENAPDPSPVRVDSGIVEGSEITPLYDPLISKLITYGATRSEALFNMRRALDTYVIRGVTNNINFLRSVVDNKRFIEGNITTNFIPEEFPHYTGYELDDKQKAQLRIAAACIHNTLTKQMPQMQGATMRFPVLTEDQELVVTLGGDSENLLVQKGAGEQSDVFFVSTPQGQSAFRLVFFSWDYALWMFENTTGARISVQAISLKHPMYKLSFCGSVFDVLVNSPEAHELWGVMPSIEEKHDDKKVLSPMPGLVKKILVKEGQEVLAGQSLCVVEAMKMQNSIKAERDGVIAKVRVSVGSSVDVDAVLIEFSDAVLEEQATN